MSWNLAVVLILITAVVLFVAFKIAHAVQREIDKSKDDAAEYEKKESPYQWIWSLSHWIWVGGFGGLKYVYKEWKTAPKDSIEKFLWTMLLAAIAAAAVWIMIRILDRIINRESKPLARPDTAQLP